MVLVSITILAIMGTLFTAIAMRSYEYSYAKLCKQQAYYTARSSIEAFYSLVTSNTTMLSALLIELQTEYNNQVAASTSGVVDPTTVSVKVGSTGGSGLVSGGFFDTFLGNCDLTVRYADQKMSQLSIEAHATYNGYTESARALIARTNLAASELKKIFDNTFCLQVPISTIVTEKVVGDIYISQPAPYITDDEGNLVTTGNEGVYNTVLEALKKNGQYGTYPAAVAGQYIRDAAGNIVTNTGTDAGKYNAVLRDTVYGQAQASTEDSTLIGHTKPLDMDNTPMQGGFYNDWVEFYMFAATPGDTALDGNLYAHSRILIGLVDKDHSNRQYISYWDADQQRRVFPSRASYQVTSDVFPAYGLEGDSDGSVLNYEHGFSEDVFFDHTRSDVLDRSVSQFRLNGNMYLWEDARIENFDSTQTENAFTGVKNNIYAAKDLYIDGFVISGWDSIFAWANMQVSHQVSVYGDVVVAGDALISGADIYGDVYCFGNELSLVDVNVYGNIYFSGSKFNAVELNVNSGTLTVNYGGKTATQTCNGGNIVIQGLSGASNYARYDASAGFGTAQDVGGSASSFDWGATFTNCNVYGSIWSAVNTHILCSKWDAGSSSLPDKYGNIYVEKYLFIDLIWPYQIEQNGVNVSGHHDNWLATENNDYNVAARWNCFERTSSSQVIYAERFQLRTNQVSVGWLQRTDVNYLGTLIVGGGGLYIDGNDSWHDEETVNYSGDNSTKFVALNTTMQSANGMWDADFDSTRYGLGTADIAGLVATGYNNVAGALSYKLAQVLSAFEHSDVVTFEDTVFGNTQIWEDKVITLHTWSPPLHGTDEEDLETGKVVNYAGGDDGFVGNAAQDAVEKYLDFLRANPDYGSVSGSEVGGDYTLTIKRSACFATYADFSRFDRVVIDTTDGNVHIKFMGGAEFGDPDATSYDNGSEVVLKGGNLTFWYLYQEEGYDLGNPTLKVNNFTQLGLVQAGTGAGYTLDGLYIVSNDDSLMYFGKDVSLNGFVYAPYSHLFLEPGSSGTLNTLNGCMAIESLILMSGADSSDSFWDDIRHWWNDNVAWDSNDIVDSVVSQYKKSYYDYVMPPLIMDVGFQYGDTVGEIQDFNQVVWEFMGYY